MLKCHQPTLSTLVPILPYGRTSGWADDDAHDVNEPWGSHEHPPCSSRVVLETHHENDGD